ncbi:MAG TPA: MBL fold metallo-hydrolase [Solimonas sp.]
MSRIVDAVTAVLLCGDELLVTRRQPFLNAFPGYHAFPGGKVDAEDADGAPLPAIWASEDARLLRALARELKEELDYDLFAAQASGAVLQLQALGIALTPPPAPVRFNTHFFVIELREKPAFTVDTQELAAADWAPTHEWRRRYEQGQALMAPPSLAVVTALAADPRVRTVPGLHFEDRPAYALPVIEMQCGVRQILVRSHTLPPAAHTNCFLIGDSQSHRVLVDPSPADDAEMERLIELVGHYGIHEIFLTHHHPDHRERADVLARRLQVPIGMSGDTQNRIFQKTHGRFFDDLPAVNIYREGDVICRWLNQPVRVLEVPGHDEGQLALMPDDRAWCLVGDLIQGLGTVVIAKPEGDMRKYFESLQRIVDLAPRAIYPSHGMGMGTAYRLAETLKHRQQREQQVLALYRAGKNVKEMLPLIYADVDPRLLPLAQMNIESHLDKLRDEGVIVA